MKLGPGWLGDRLLDPGRREGGGQPAQRGAAVGRGAHPRPREFANFSDRNISEKISEIFKFSKKNLKNASLVMVLTSVDSPKRINAGRIPTVEQLISRVYMKNSAGWHWIIIDKSDGNGVMLKSCCFYGSIVAPVKLC